jgi:hypothetical protein
MLRALGKRVVGAWVLSILVGPAPAWAWGDDGHCIVARIAEAHLSARARQGIQDLIGDRSLSDPRIAVWADAIKKSAFYKRRYPDNPKWHYIDLDVKTDLAALDFHKACAGGNCVFAKLPHFVEVLRDPRADGQDRREALYFVVHFVADAHQPLHCAERNNDHGGNLVRVKVASDEGPPNPIPNLHRVWDVDLVKKAIGGLSWADFADRLDARITQEQRKAWASGDLKAWVLEAHKLARTKTYADVPERGPDDEPFVLSEKYLADNAEVVAVQLQRAGVRLAKVLNEAFD